MTAPLTIRAATSLEEFKGLAQEWEQLLRTVPGHSLFLTWEWLYIWTKHYLRDSRLRILLMLDDQERLVGLAPGSDRPACRPQERSGRPAHQNRHHGLTGSKACAGGSCSRALSRSRRRISASNA